MTPEPSQVWLAVDPIDMRLGIDGLSLRVQQTLGKAPCDGSAYAFSNKRGNRIVSSQPPHLANAFKTV